MTENKYLIDIVKAQDALIFLNNRIDDKEYKGNKKLWGGADVIIGRFPVKKSTGWFSNNDKCIVTPFCRELSWLFFELRDIFYKYGLIDYSSKYMFFGRLADSAEKYINSKEGEIGNKKDLLMSVRNEAENILKEILKIIPHISN